MHETVDQVKEPRSAWTYNPGQRRVRLAPQVAYDNPGTAADGLRTNDDFGMYNGATDRYNWKLVGKQEMYMPYNSYKLSGNEVKIRGRAEAGPHQPGPRALRTAPRLGRRGDAEGRDQPHLHEARLLHRRGQLVDRRRPTSTTRACELWRVSEQHTINFYDIPMLYGTVEVHHDLQSGRYIAMGLRNEEPKVYETIKRDRADYTPAGLRGIGTR